MSPAPVRCFTTTSARLLGVAIVSLAFSGSVSAQSGAPVRLGETELFPELRLTYFSDSNIYRSEDGTEASGAVISPGLLWKAENRNMLLSARYLADIGRADESDADFDSHRLRLTGDADFSSRSRLRTRLQLSRETEARGTGLSSGIGETLDESIIRNLVEGSVEYQYGATGARGNIHAGLKIKDRSYGNLENLTQRAEYTAIEPSFAFFYRLSGQTRAVAELVFTDYDYARAVDDRQSIKYFLGLDWPESARGGGSAKIGLIQSDFPDAPERDGRDFAFEIGGYFVPDEHSRFDLTAERTIFDLNQEIGATDRSTLDEIDLTWRYDWSDRVSHDFDIGVDLIDRECDPDTDSFLNSGLTLNYSLRRWLLVGAGAELGRRRFGGCTELADNPGSFDYDRRYYSLFVQATL